MKEAFGGTFMLKLFMVFFIIYVTFIFVALNFAKHYRIKNYVVNYLEQKQYYFEDEKTSSAKYTDLENYLANVPYTFSEKLAEDKCDDYANGGDKTTFKGVCIIPMGVKSSGKYVDPYYKVIVFFGAEFPFLGINITIPISGETMIIHQTT